MQTALMVTTILMNLFGAAIAALFAVTARSMPEAAYRSWAVVCVVLIAVTLVTVRVQSTVSRDSEPGDRRARAFTIASHMLLAIAWLAMIGALAAMYFG